MKQLLERNAIAFLMLVTAIGLAVGYVTLQLMLHFGHSPNISELGGLVSAGSVGLVGAIYAQLA